MKKIFMCAAAVAMLGLASCSGNKTAEAADSVQNAVEEVEQTTEVAIDSVAPDSAQVEVAQETVEAAAPAAEAAQN
ncbi:MAG: hypothetical protein HDR80_06125 [Bacteroides sp.]|nr:hypothetical protein [Bacteroides sp.]